MSVSSALVLHCYVKLLLISVCSTKSDIVFVLDSSGSIGFDNWLLILDFVSSMIDRLNVASDKIHVGLVVFSNNAAVEFYLGDYTRKSELMDIVANIDYQDGVTNTASALRMMREDVFSGGYGDREDVPDVAIVVTDGASTEEDTIDEARLAHAQGITVLALGIGDATTLNLEELEGIASRSELVTLTDNFLTLDGIVNEMIDEVCVEIPVTTEPDPGES